MIRTPLATVTLVVAMALGLAACKQDAPATTPSATGPAQQASGADAQQAAVAEKAIADLMANPGPEPVEGTDYEVIAQGQPFEPQQGKIEIAEVFNHVCPACASFQPLVSAWKAKLPADVSFVYVPAQFGGPFDVYARSFYASQALGLEEKAHDALYRAIHVDHTLKGERGRDTPQDIARFYQAYGADPAQFVETMGSFAVEGKLAKARRFMQQTGVQGTPTLVVAGKYRVTGAENSTRSDQIRIANQLVARERAAAGGAPASGPVPEAPAPAEAAQ